MIKKITINAALSKKYLIIDMTTPVKDYEEYDFHRGMKCKINGYPFELMSENGELSLEAGAIYLTAFKQHSEVVPCFEAGETIAVIQLYDGFAECYEITLPDRITQQSFIIK